VVLAADNMNINIYTQRDIEPARAPVANLLGRALRVVAGPAPLRQSAALSARVQ